MCIRDRTHAVLGENGAGKSTLMKIIYGAVKPDAGTVMFNGKTVHIRNPQEARALGLSMVFQHFSLFDTITVAENVWLGLSKSLSLQQVTRSIEAKAAEYGLDIDPARPVHTLSAVSYTHLDVYKRQHLRQADHVLGRVQNRAVAGAAAQVPRERLLRHLAADDLALEHLVLVQAKQTHGKSRGTKAALAGMTLHLSLIHI